MLFNVLNDERVGGLIGLLPAYVSWSHCLPCRVGHWSRPSTGLVGSGRVGPRFFPYLVGWVGSGPFVWVTLDYAKCNCKVDTIC